MTRNQTRPYEPRQPLVLNEPRSLRLGEPARQDQRARQPRTDAYADCNAAADSSTDGCTYSGTHGSTSAGRPTNHLYRWHVRRRIGSRPGDLPQLEPVFRMLLGAFEWLRRVHRRNYREQLHTVSPACHNFSVRRWVLRPRLRNMDA